MTIRMQMNVIPAGIYWKSSAGLITISDGMGGQLTIADKNLGATTVYIEGSTMSSTNCGYFYQRGNNYGFPYTGATSTSTTQVDASSYGPGNYYSSSTFIKKSAWDSSRNHNLRGGLSDNIEDKRGPCPSGYHVPMKEEITLLENIGISIGLFNSNSNSPMFRIYLKIPYAGIIRTNTGTHYGAENNWPYGKLLCCDEDVFSTANNRAYGISVNNSTYFTTVQWHDNSDGNNIRPFKNDVSVPDSTRTVLYQPS